MHDTVCAGNESMCQQKSLLTSKTSFAESAASRIHNVSYVIIEFIKTAYSSFEILFP